MCYQCCALAKLIVRAKKKKTISNLYFFQGISAVYRIAYLVLEALLLLLHITRTSYKRCLNGNTKMDIVFYEPVTYE